MMRVSALWAVCLLMVLFAWPQKGRAASSLWQISGETSVRLISATDSVAEKADSLSFGIEFRLEPGWKIYWRSPGDAGLPPEAAWADSTNVTAVKWHWPVPERFIALGLQTLGYKDHVVLPLTVIPDQMGKAVSLSGRLSYLACAELCVPHEVNLSLTLPPGTGLSGAEGALIEQFQSAVPLPAEAAGIQFETVNWRAKTEGVQIQVEAVSTRPLSTPDLLLEGPEGSYFDPPKVTVSGQTALFLTSGGGVQQKEGQPFPLILTLLDKDIAAEAIVTATPDSEVNASGMSVSPPTLMGILFLALLGGLVLNLMPCVLPVISLKLMAVLQSDRKAPSSLRTGFLAAAAGILTAFLALAVVLAGLKEAGAMVGWGIQFQQPVFLSLMVVVMTLFAASLAGLFEFGLPAVLADRMAGTGYSGLAGDFASGLFATLLATPCSAPFVGTAVGFALTQNTMTILLVFFVMGLGLALPWLLAALFPGTVMEILPRSGPWIKWMKALLAVALVSAALWLLSVLLTVAGQNVVISVATLAALSAVVLFVRRMMPETRLARHAGWVCGGLLAAAVIVPAMEKAPSSNSGALTGTSSIRWQPFDEEAISVFVAEGKTVFVDVTADWCLTCIVNKEMVLETSVVAEQLNAPNIITMQADWTRPDTAISLYLNRYGRYGIPFNIVYGPDNPEGILLPELLTTKTVLQTLMEAGYKNTAK